MRTFATPNPAIEVYKGAIKLTPDDVIPWSNRSAACFEIGKYQECASASLKALDLADNKNTSLRTKIQLRHCNAYLHLPKPRDADELLATIPSDRC
jgi:tetratricopeptide (TPR) repeat protein